MASVAEKVFVITGSASGIGLATATILLAHSTLLGLCNISEHSLSKLISDLSKKQKARIITDTVNITNRSAITSFLRLTKKKFSKIDRIVNLARTVGHKLRHHKIWEINEQEYNFIMNINVKGIFNILSKALKPGILQEPGSIIHAASIFAERGFSKGSVYSTSKHTGVGMAKSTALKAGKRGIRVNIVLP
jgi:NAD(P)-dependent dehydrogenase (short-subunit alcohol dehydrogenase family)